MSPKTINTVNDTMAILYLPLPNNVKLVAISPQTIGPTKEEARSIRPKKANARLCLPCGAKYPITERETAQFAPNQNPIRIAAVTNILKSRIKARIGKIKIQPIIITTRVFLWPILSAISPDIIPPTEEVTKAPNNIYVLIVSDTSQTLSKKIGKLLAAVKTASFKKKKAIKNAKIPGYKKRSIDSRQNFFVSVRKE